ncbi:MAG: carbohydrate binding domain-containing protein, partial [Litorilituus sp.]|nr:carbohydrate binding domain-containing protein [Litorilituus sp.]
GDIAATELTLTVNDGTVDTEQTFTITVAEAEEEKTPVLVVFEEDANPLWPAWDCCGSSTPAIITDADAGYGQVTQFTINGDTVVGFNARDAEDGVAFDTPAGTTLEFDLKVTTMPTNVDAVWKLKVEDSGDGAKEVDLTTSVEGQAPVLDTWLHYTFNTADLGLSNIDLIMMFPAWGTGDGAEFSVDNVKFYFDEQVGERTPGLSGNGATTTTAIGVDFEGSQLTWESFDTAKVQFVANPKTNGINTSSTVALFDILQGDGEWIGARTEGIDNFALDASNCVVKLDVYKDTISNVSVKFEKQHSDGWGSSGHISAANTVTNQWETLSFDFCSVIGHAENDDIGGFAIFPDNTGSRSQNTMNYIDNLMFTAQGDVEEPVGGELVLNGGFDNGSDNWVMGGAVITEGDNSVFQATVDAPGDVWSVNLSQVMTLVAGQSYTLTFKAKAEVARTIVVGLGFNHDPWTASTENVTLTTEWATYTYTITPEAGDNNSRVLFDMGGEAGDVYLDDISVVAVD